MNGHYCLSCGEKLKRMNPSTNKYECPKCRTTWYRVIRHTIVEWGEGEKMNDVNDIFQVDYLLDEKKIKINLPEEVWEKIDSIIMTRRFQKIKTIRVFHREKEDK